MKYRFTGNGKIIYQDQLLTKGDTIELSSCDRADFEEVKETRKTSPRKRAKRS